MTKTATKTVEQWITENGITADIVPAPDNPEWRGTPGDGTAHFAVTLRREGQDGSHLVYFSVGSGIVGMFIDQSPEWRKMCMRAQYLDDNGVWKRNGETPSFNRIDNLKVIASDDLCKEAMRVLAPKYRPELADIINSMASDVTGIEGETFETWADGLGYNSDSLSDKHTFEACLKERQQLISLAGFPAVEKLCYEIERL